jgi:nitrate/nitrite-specific signal transduction histidine kinase
LRLLRLVSDPIVQLARIAGRITAEENYSLRATALGNDESGVLVRSFNQMLERIEQRDLALQNAKDGLEQRVEQRTADLQKEVAERRLVAPSEADTALCSPHPRMASIVARLAAVAECFQLRREAATEE